MSTINNNNFTNTTQPALNLVDLPLDTLTLICEHLNMNEACNLYRTGSKNLREAIAETEFDFYGTKEWIPKGVSVKQFRKVFASAIGIRTSEPHKISQEDFDCLVPNLCKNKPKGLAKVRIDMSNPYGYCPFIKYSKKAFEKLKGIHTLDISNNKLVRYRHLKSLKDIKCLIMSECSHIHQSVLQYFTKVNISNVTWYYDEDENVDFDDIEYEYYNQLFKLDVLKSDMGFGPDEYYYDDDTDSLIDYEDYRDFDDEDWRRYNDDY